MEKLKLSSTKCSNIHIGKANNECHKLKVHENSMKCSKQESYLGDIIHESGKVRHNIEKRKSKGYGIIANILAIVNEIPLAHWKVEAGLKLRQAMLINGVLFNSEAWQGIYLKDIMLLEKVDEALLRGLLSAHPKIPLEALYLETRCLPIRFILASRRIMYLHTILHRDKTEMIRRVYEAQVKDPSPGDFIDIVKSDCNRIGLEMTDKEISQISKYKSKKIVKSKISNAAFKHLLAVKEEH